MRPILLTSPPQPIEEETREAGCASGGADGIRFGRAIKPGGVAGRFSVRRPDGSRCWSVTLLLARCSTNCTLMGGGSRSNRRASDCVSSRTKHQRVAGCSADRLNTGGFSFERGLYPLPASFHLSGSCSSEFVQTPRLTSSISFTLAENSSPSLRKCSTAVSSNTEFANR
jgi:hypothetical protein